MYLKHRIPLLRVDYVGVPPAELLCLAANEWNTLSTKEKEFYKTMGNDATLGSVMLPDAAVTALKRVASSDVISWDFDQMMAFCETYWEWDPMTLAELCDHLNECPWKAPIYKQWREMFRCYGVVDMVNRRVINMGVDNDVIMLRYFQLVEKKKAKWAWKEYVSWVVNEYVPKAHRALVLEFML